MYQLDFNEKRLGLYHEEEGELWFSYPGHCVLSNTLHAIWNFISGTSLPSLDGNEFLSANI